MPFQTIDKVEIHKNGTIMISIDKKTLVIAFDEDAFLEEIWSIIPDNAAPYAKHSWSVSLTDERKVVLVINKANN